LHISVQKTPSPLPAESDVVAVVVDVLRATSVISMAIQNGAAKVYCCVEIEESRQLAVAVSPSALLCGERLCKPIAGFDLGNSPSDYSSAVVGGRSLVMTTTNGTRAMNAAKQARRVYAGSFLNLSALAKKLLHEPKIVVVCAGTDGSETEEDILFAGALIASVVAFSKKVELDRTAEDAVEFWNSFQEEGFSLAEKLYQTRGGVNLVAAGYRSDIDVCAMIDGVTSVPEMVDREPIMLINASGK